MDDDLTMLQLLFGSQVHQTSHDQIKYTTDELNVLFTYPPDYPKSPFSYETSVPLDPVLAVKLDGCRSSTLDFITTLAQNVALTAETIASPKGAEDFKRAIIDTHNHVFSNQYADATEYEAQVEKMAVKNGATFIAVACDPERYEEHLQEAMAHDYRITVGVHPFTFERLFHENEALYYERADALLERLAGFLRAHIDEVGKHIVAIGECGVSATDPQLMRLQANTTRYHADLAIKYDLPLVIHAHRKEELSEATAFVLENQTQYRRLRLNIHGFSADVDQLKDLNSVVEQLMFSCSLMLLKQSSNFKKAVRRLGIDKVLVETDSPVLRANDDEVSGPYNILNVLEKLADVLEVNIDDLNGQVNNNAREFFRL